MNGPGRGENYIGFRSSICSRYKDRNRRRIAERVVDLALESGIEFWPDSRETIQTSLGMKYRERYGTGIIFTIFLQFVVQFIIQWVVKKLIERWTRDRGEILRLRKERFG